MIFELAGDFTAVLAAMPADHPKRRMLSLLEEAIRRDIHFIARHPTTLFQCMWNNCWWYDCPDAAKHYVEPEGGWTAQNAPWKRANESKLYLLMERWCENRKQSTTPHWIRSQRPPSVHLGTALKAILRGHKGYVNSVSYSPDGRRIASGAYDKTVRVWNAESGAELNVMHGHEDEVKSVSYSPDGRRIVSGSSDGTLRVWDVESGAELIVLHRVDHFITYSPDGVLTVSYSPDGRRIISGSYDKTIRVWDAESGAELAVLRGHQSDVNSVSYSPDGRRIVSGSYDKTIRVWDAESGAELAILRGHQSDVNSVSYSPDCRRIVSGSSDGTLRIWDAESGAELAVLHGHGVAGVFCVSYSPDGQRIVSGGHKALRVWDAESGTELAVLRGHETLVMSVSYSPCGQRIVSCCGFDRILVWDTTRDAGMVVLHEHEFWIQSLAFSPDGKRLVSICYGNEVRLWDTQSWTELATLSKFEFDFQTLRYAGFLYLTIGDVKVRVSDLGSKLHLEVIRGPGHVASTTVGVGTSSTPPCHAIRNGFQTIIEPTGGSEPVAWFLGMLGVHADIVTHPNGYIWAGALFNDLYIITLESGDETRSTGKIGEAVAHWLRICAERILCLFRRK